MILDHIRNGNIHVTNRDKLIWNNKIGYEDVLEYPDEETVVVKDMPDGFFPGEN